MSAIASTGLAAEIQAIGGATSNTTEGTSLLQTVQDGLELIAISLARLDALAVAFKTVSMTDYQRAQLNTEIQTLLSEIDEAAERGADAVIGIDLDYEVIGGDKNTMLMVSANGTAVRVS